MSARAEASEQLSGQIVDSLTAGLLVVDRDGPRGDSQSGGPPAARARRPSAVGAHYRDAAAAAPPLAAVIAECLTTGDADRAAIGRRCPADDRPSHLGVTVSPLGDRGQTRAASSACSPT